jgi:4-amino-4-deoxy-L-arabinose transferase-like glycosyltransferase
MLVIPAALLLIYVLQCVWFISTQSLTVDEPGHIAAGLAMWRHGRFVMLNDQPPLARLIFTAPLAAFSNTQLDNIHERLFTTDPALAWWARPPIVLLGVLLGISLWLAAREWLSESAANFALALFAFSPALIAHFSLATMDGAATLTIFLVVLQLARWRKNPSRWQTMWFGIALGLMLMSKFYAPPLFLIALYIITLNTTDGIERSRRWHWKHVAAVAALAWAVVWAGYFFHVSIARVENHALIIHMPHRENDFSLPVNFSFPGRVFWPGAEYIEGLYLVANHNLTGHDSMLLGEVSRTGGWKSYYFYVIALKWPVVVLALALVGSLAIVRKRVRLPAGWLIIISIPGTLFVMAVFARIQIGDRHILPLYPFALLLAAAAWQGLSSHRAARLLLLLALALNAFECLRFAPDYMSYFTPFVDQSKSYKLLTDSNTDWGQGLVALKKYQDAHPNDLIHLAYFGTVDPTIYGIRYRRMRPADHPSGTVVVSATHLSGQLLTDPDSYKWLLRYPPKTILNHTLYVFEVPERSKR